MTDVYTHAADVLQALISVASSSDRDTNSYLMSSLSRDGASRRSECASRVGLLINLYLRSFKNGNTMTVPITWAHRTEFTTLFLPPPSSWIFYFRPRSLPGCYRAVRTQGAVNTYWIKTRLLGGSTFWAISFGKGLEGFERGQNENSLVELQKDLVTYLYKAPVVSTIFALPSFTSLFRAHRHLPKPAHWMDETENST